MNSPQPKSSHFKKLSVKLGMTATKVYCHLSSVEEDALNKNINLLAKREWKRKRTSFTRLKSIKVHWKNKLLARLESEEFFLLHKYPQTGEIKKEFMGSGLCFVPSSPTLISPISTKDENIWWPVTGPRALTPSYSCRGTPDDMPHTHFISPERLRS